MANLGSFGAAVREADPQAEPDTFDFCGERFTVVGRMPQMLAVQLGAAATGKIDEQEGLGAIWEALRCALTVPERKQMAPDAADGLTLVESTIPADPSQFQRLYRLAVERCVEIDDLVALAMALFEVETGRPTEQRPASPAGSLPTSTSSSTSSSASPVWPGMTPVDQVLLG